MKLQELLDKAAHERVIGLVGEADTDGFESKQQYFNAWNFGQSKEFRQFHVRSSAAV